MYNFSFAPCIAGGLGRIDDHYLNSCLYKIKKYEAEKLQRIASEETSRRTLKEMVGFIHNHKRLTPQEKHEDLVKAEKLAANFPSVDEDKDRVRTSAVINNLYDFFGM